MARYFECLHCGAVTPVEETPPKCRRCGHGTGVIHAQKPETIDRKSGQDRRTSERDRRGGPEGTSNMLTASEEASAL